jgi:hypothetical protein
MAVAAIGCSHPDFTPTVIDVREPGCCTRARTQGGGSLLAPAPNPLLGSMG